MNDSFKSVDEVNKHLDSVSKGREKREPNTQPAGSVWRKGQRIYDTVCVKPTGRTPAEEEHCRQMQKKQLMQAPAAIASMGLGDSVVLARNHEANVEEEVFIVLEGNKIFAESASKKNLEKIDITNILPHEFKSELADNPQKSFDSAFILSVDGNVYPGRPGAGPSMHDPGEPDEPAEVEIEQAELMLDKDGSGLTRDFKVDISKTLHNHPKFRAHLEDKLIENADPGDYEPPDYDEDR